MKKAGIITHYNVHNHGAHLQLYALIQVLKSMGYDAKALQFQKNYDFMGGPEIEKKYTISLQSIPIYTKYLVTNGLDRTLYNINKRKTLDAFRKANNVVGQYYSEATDLDVVVIGSDEIFSIEAGPNPWYYGIGVPCKNQISYAASFGPTTVKLIEEHNVSGLIKGGLDALKDIAVRDQNSYDIVKYFSGRESTIVCDPVLLYEFPKQINPKSIAEFKRSQKEKYCVVYSYDYNMNDVETVKGIREYAAKRNLKIYSIGYFHRWADKNINLDPLDVFKWFSCADMVFTDTFHGSVISLATGAQFISKIRGNRNKLAFLLDQYGVSDREIEKFNNIEKIAKKAIDYQIVNNMIKEIRNISHQYLKRALEGVNK